jgi:hypothetical protein
MVSNDYILFFCVILLSRRYADTQIGVPAFSPSDKDDVDQLAKKAKIDGMRSVINLKKIEAINTQIAVMERLENVYVARMGRDAYERKLVNLANKLPDML